MWFERIVKPHSVGKAYLCRYADDESMCILK
jgi:hypothetical protein